MKLLSKTTTKPIEVLKESYAAKTGKSKLDQLYKLSPFEFLGALVQVEQNIPIVFHLSHLYLRINLISESNENFKIYGQLLFHQTMNYIKRCYGGLSFEQWQQYLKPIYESNKQIRSATILTELINLKLDISKTENFVLARDSIKNWITDEILENKLESQLVELYCG
jgi:hypothetical protein